MNRPGLVGIEYKFNQQGETSAIEVKFQGFGNGESLTSTVVIHGENLDDLTRAQIEQKGRERLLAIVTGETAE